MDSLNAQFINIINSESILNVVITTLGAESIPLHFMLQDHRENPQSFGYGEVFTCVNVRLRTFDNVDINYRY